MPKNVQIGSNPHIIPEQGDNPDWGENTTDWMIDVTDALANVQGPNDILITTTTLNNNQSTPANISGLVFNTGDVQAVKIEFLIIRIFDSGSTTLTESGTIKGNYDGSEFFINTDAVGDSGVTITVTNSGQFQYISDDKTNHVSSTMRYKATTIDQA